MLILWLVGTFPLNGDRMAVSILDIAKHAGVSKSTVSRVMCGGSVNETTKEIVLRAMQELGYTPNYMARGLRGRKNPVVGILSSGGEMFQDRSLCLRFSAIVDTMCAHNYDLLLVNDKDEIVNGVSAGKYISYLQDKRIDGLITIGYSDLQEVRRAASEFRNVVYAGERIDHGRGFRVYQGNYDYSKDLYKLLLSKGHTSIMTVSYSLSDVERLVFYREKALRDAASELAVEIGDCLFFSPYTKGSSSRAAALSSEGLDILFQTFTRGGYTALYVDDAIFARMIVSYFYRHALVPYEDYSIVSLERDDGIGSSEEKFITTASFSEYLCGQNTAQLMIEVIENEDLHYKDVLIPYRINERKSIRDIRGDSFR